MQSQYQRTRAIGSKGSFPGYEDWNGIHVSPEARKRFADFEAQYTHLRAQEERVFSPEEIRQLPLTPKDHPHHAEWEMRRHTVSAFLDYLKKKGSNMSLLDVGCGNGFFTHLLAQAGNNVVGVDINLFELEQAVSAFGHNNPSWYYADITRDLLPLAHVDLITFNASLAYFSDPPLLLKRCLEFLKPGGEIHILDTPVYDDEKAASIARASSARYFQSKGSPGMMMYYHFHTWDVFKEFDHTVNGRIKSLLNKIAGLRRSPFPWIIIKKH